MSVLQWEVTGPYMERTSIVRGGFFALVVRDLEGGWRWFVRSTKGPDPLASGSTALGCSAAQRAAEAKIEELQEETA